MRRQVGSIMLCLSLGGCAFQGSVQRIGVEYNDAVAGMANELTLLNILRAREDLPLHYTSVSRLSGSVTVKAGGNINAALRADATTGTNQTATTTSASPGTVATVINQVVEGVDVVTPTVSGEISTGPTFDIAVLDTQKFYNGIMGAIPFPTIENYIGQGYSDQLLMRLLIERIDFNAADGANKGETLFSWVNAASGEEARQFAKNIQCYSLHGGTETKKPVDLAPASRLRRADPTSAVGLTIQELAMLDGKTLELSGTLGATATGDDKVMVRRPVPDKRLADLRLKPECYDAEGRPRGELLAALDPAAKANPAADSQAGPQSVPPASGGADGTTPPTAPALATPEFPPADRVYLGNSRAIVLGKDKASDVEVPVKLAITFRSPESVIRFVGRYLRADKPDTDLGGLPLFAVVDGRPARSLVTSEVLGKRYSITDDANRRRNMQVIAIIQQLLNLHKESADRPVTVPVQVIGGS